MLQCLQAEPQKYQKDLIKCKIIFYIFHLKRRFLRHQYYICTHTYMCACVNTYLYKQYVFMKKVLCLWKPDDAITLVKSNSLSESTKIFQRESSLHGVMCRVFWGLLICQVLFPIILMLLELCCTQYGISTQKQLGALVPFASWRLSQLFFWFQDIALQCYEISH